MRLLPPAIQYPWMSLIQAKSHAQTYWYVEKIGLKPGVVRLQEKRQKLTAPYGVFHNPSSIEKRSCQNNEQRTFNSAESPLKQCLWALQARAGQVISCSICNWCPLFYRTVSMDQTWVGRWIVWAATIPSRACLWAQAVRAAVWAACRRSWMRAALNWSWCIVTRAQLIPLPPLFIRRYVRWCSP